MTNIPCEWIPGHVVIGDDNSHWAVIGCLDIINPMERSWGELHDQTRRTIRIQELSDWLLQQGWMALPRPADSSVAVLLHSERDLTLLLLLLGQSKVEYRETIVGKFTVYTKHSVYDAILASGLIQEPKTKRQKRKMLYATKIKRLQRALDES